MNLASSTRLTPCILVGEYRQAPPSQARLTDLYRTARNTVTINGTHEETQKLNILQRIQSLEQAPNSSQMFTYIVLALRLT